MSNEKKVNQQNHKRLECTEYPSDKWKYIDTSTKLLRDMSLLEPPYCFVAGTLVHTDKGLVPIEEMKVGDMVLSRPENGKGEVSYKKVTKTFVTEKQPIWGTVVGASADQTGETAKYELIISTAGHPFWKKDEFDPDSDGKWTVLSDLEYGASLWGCLYSDHAVIENLPLLQSMNPNEAFYYTSRDDGTGIMLDVAKYKKGNYVFPNYFEDDSHEVENCDENGHTIEDYHYEDVYNIEVEDFHTYFVGELGVWVHNTCNPRTEVHLAGFKTTP